ncbi:MAG TPA: acyl-CoA dehydrogenase family protein [Myxococcales bacterium]|nr:acyl-CoA dehydrogenase family protein [Myxococcales bacterium]
MRFELSEEQAAVRDLARKFAQEKVAPAARERDRTHRYPAAELHAMGELGLLGVNVPEAYGGAAAGAVAYAAAVMELAEACCSTSVVMAVTNMVCEQIVAWGTEAQRRQWVPKLTSGAAVAGAFALSEPQCGSDASAMTTTAVRTGDRFTISGAKQWITSGDHAGVFLVWARTAGPGAKGISCFIVPGGTKGLVAGKPEHKMGLNGSSTVGLTLEGCEVPAENLLGELGGGFKIAMTALDGGRIGIGAQAVGTLRACLAASRRYALDRRAFGKPIADQQAIRWKLADMAADLAAAELLVFRAAWLKERGRPFTREASMAKLFASEASNRAASQAVQVHGGYGYLDEFPVERYFRDARVQTIYEGTSEVQRVVIARQVLK